MKRMISVLGLSAASLLAISAASAQTVTGTLNLTGTVPPKCSVTGGNSATVALGDLSGADGRLSTTLGTTTFAAPAAFFDFSVTCTGAQPTAAVDANPLVSATGAVSGYTNTVHLTGSATMTLVSGGPQTITNDSDQVAGSATNLTARLANSLTNVTIKAYALKTSNAADLLVAATDYAGSVVVTIAPGI